jgi:hypothetical protein
MRNSFEFRRNRKSSEEVYVYTKKKSPFKKIRRKSCQNRQSVEIPKKIKIFTKNDFEKENIPCSSNKSLQIINILNNFIGKEFYKDFPINNINNKQKIILNDDNDNKKLKPSNKKSIKNKSDTKDNNETNIPRVMMAQSKKEVFNSLSLLDSDSLNFMNKESVVKGKRSETESKTKSHIGYGRRSVDISCYNKNITNQFKNKLKYNCKKTSEKSYISDDKMITSSKKNILDELLMKDLNEDEIIKIKENIVNDMNLLQLKKRISLLKKTYVFKGSNKMEKEKNNLEKVKTFHYPNIKEVNIIPNINEHEETYDSLMNKKKSDKSMNENSKKNKLKFSNKNRAIVRKANLFDSLDEEDGFYEKTIDIYIPPNSIFLRIFDILLLISSLIYFIMIPYFLSSDFFVTEVNHSFISILIFIDIIYIMDIIINFFRPYKSFDDSLIKSTKKIFINYVKSWFLIDLIQAIPYFSLFDFLKKKKYFGQSENLYLTND